jgi:hypothetical protein
MLRFVRLNDSALSRTVGSRGLTLLVVALAAGGCSAGFDRLDLAPMNYSGGPTGSECDHQEGQSARPDGARQGTVIQTHKTQHVIHPSTRSQLTVNWLTRR